MRDSCAACRDNDLHIFSAHPPLPSLHKKTYRHSQRIGQHHHNCQHGTYFPRLSHSFRLLPLRPKQIEEERRSEDCRNVNTDEDVERRNTDVVIVVL